MTTETPTNNYSYVNANPGSYTNPQNPSSQNNVVAPDPNTAIKTAPNISPTSGVQTNPPPTQPSNNSGVNQNINFMGQNYDLSTTSGMSAYKSAVNATPNNQNTTTPNPTPSPTDADTTERDRISKDLYDKGQQVFNTINGIVNGSVPLNAGEQAQVDSLKQSYQQLIDQQVLQNTNSSGVANIRGYQTGSAEYDPTFQVKTIGSIVTAGIGKVADLNTKMAGAVAQLTESLQNNDIANIKSAYDEYKSASDDRITTLNKTISDTQAAIKQANDDYYNQVTKPINDIATEAAKNGADAKTIASISSAGSVQDAINAASSSLQTATGQLGDYLQYKRDAISSGLSPISYGDWKQKDDAQTAKEKVSEAYATAFATASGKAAAETKFQQTTPSTPVESPLGITYNAPASIAPYVSFSSNGVKYVDLSSFKGTPTEANQAVNDAQAAGYKVITNKNTALDVQNITDANTKLDSMKTAFDNITQGNAAERDSYGAAFTWAAKALQTDPNVVGSSVYEDAALDILKAMSGVQGFRGGASMVNKVQSTFPTATDTKASADAKIAVLKQLIGDRETALVGKPSASDQIMVKEKQNENNLTDNLNNIKTSNPKLYSTASSMFTAINPDTGQPYSASDILQAFPELSSQ